MVLNLDLNILPSAVDDVPVGDSLDLSLSIGLPWESGLSQIQTTTMLETVDDEVVICSPRRFFEAREKSRRNHRVVEVIDDEDDSQRESKVRFAPGSNSRHRRSPPKRTVVNGDRCIDLESNENTKSNNIAEGAEKSQCVPPPKAPSFSCPVCMGLLVEETSTKCGHIFCKICISQAIAAQKKCPSCRQKLKARDTFRIYLPDSY